MWTITFIRKSDGYELTLEELSLEEYTTLCAAIDPEWMIRP